MSTRWLRFLSLGCLAIMTTWNPSAGDDVPTALNYQMKTLEGKDIKLSQYQGKAILIVNVASQCGLTPQYQQLQAMHEKFKDAGLAILGFPCNQFGQQEPGSATEIRQFCTGNYGVTFDMFAKIDVNGENTCELYKHLKGLDTHPKGAGDISWNFEKFLLDRHGNVVARFAPKTRPDDPAVVTAVEKVLATK